MTCLTRMKMPKCFFDQMSDNDNIYYIDNVNNCNSSACPPNLCNHISLPYRVPNDCFTDCSLTESFDCVLLQTQRPLKAMQPWACTCHPKKKIFIHSVKANWSCAIMAITRSTATKEPLLSKNAPHRSMLSRLRKSQ